MLGTPFPVNFNQQEFANCAFSCLHLLMICHNNHIILGDIKRSNFMQGQGGQIGLIDFEGYRVYDEPQSETRKDLSYSSMYRANYNTDDHFQNDLYAMALLLLELRLGEDARNIFYNCHIKAITPRILEEQDFKVFPELRKKDVGRTSRRRIATSCRSI